VAEIAVQDKEANPCPPSGSSWFIEVVPLVEEKEEDPFCVPYSDKESFSSEDSPPSLGLSSSSEESTPQETEPVQNFTIFSSSGIIPEVQNMPWEWTRKGRRSSHKNSQRVEPKSSSHQPESNVEPPQQVSCSIEDFEDLYVYHKLNQSINIERSTYSRKYYHISKLLSRKDKLHRKITVLDREIKNLVGYEESSLELINKQLEREKILERLDMQYKRLNAAKKQLGFRKIPQPTNVNRAVTKRKMKEFDEQQSFKLIKLRVNKQFSHKPCAFLPRPGWRPRCRKNTKLVVIRNRPAHTDYETKKAWKLETRYILKTNKYW